MSLDKIKKIIVDSNISEADKKFLSAVFSRASQEEIENALAFLNSSSANLSILNAIFKLKRKALEEKNSELFDRITDLELMIFKGQKDKN
jgi:hypothetical protein